jgi:outer membrane protein assembly factor BamA
MHCRLATTKTLSLLLLVFLTPSDSTAQNYRQLADSNHVAVNWSTRIRHIMIDGNEKTKAEIILREMKLQKGGEFDELEAERDRMRILNLGLFNRVEIDAVPTNSGVILLVSVNEMWYIFPYPIIFRNERDWGKISIGAGLRHNNFRGRREIIDFSFWLGFNPSVRLRYTNPWILGKLKFYTTFSVFVWRIRNLTFHSLRRL